MAYPQQETNRMYCGNCDTVFSYLVIGPLLGPIMGTLHLLSLDHGLRGETTIQCNAICCNRFGLPIDYSQDSIHVKAFLDMSTGVNHVKISWDDPLFHPVFGLR